jgi:hypothetical protein
VDVAIVGDGSCRVAKYAGLGHTRLPLVSSLSTAAGAVRELASSSNCAT